MIIPGPAAYFFRQGVNQLSGNKSRRVPIGSWEAAMGSRTRKLGSNMPRPRAANTVSEKSVSKIDPQSLVKRIYVFRCNESGLYAFTADRKGRMLPSQMYPQITWQFEHTLTLRLNGDSWRDEILSVTLDGVAARGFHLIHA